MKHHSGMDYVKAAEKAGLEIKMGRGDHCIVKAPVGRGYEVIPLHRELSDGIECKLAKWFKAAGILLSLICAVLYIVCQT